MAEFGCVFRRSLLVACLAFFLLATDSGEANQWPTLREVLREHGVATPAAPTSLDSRIHSFSVENANDLFLIAYFVWDAADRERIPPTLHIGVYDKRKQRWLESSLVPSSLPGNALSAGFGSVLRVSHTRSRIYIDMHLGPSAGTLLILTRALKPIATVPGWSLARLGDHKVFYHRSMVHFAPTHSAELWLYDSESKRDFLVYPRKPYSPLRLHYQQTVAEIYRSVGEDWFRINNHHMDPERFDSDIGPIVATEDGSRAAFTVRFGSEIGVPTDTPEFDVLVTCRALARSPRCEERELASVRKRYPGLDDESILRAELRRR